jgi:4-aminobutyrate aminotransferase
MSVPKCISKLHGMISPARGLGSRLWDTNNVRYLDMTSGIGALSIGHGNERLITHVQKQIAELTHTPQLVFGSTLPMISLNKRLIETVRHSARYLKVEPDTMLDSVFHVPSGSEATENAIKIARKFTGKQNIIAVNRGFHGRTLGALALTSSNILVKKGCYPLIPGAFFCSPTKESLHDIFKYHTDPSDTAAFIVESIQGEGGIHSIPSDFLKYAKKKCKQNNILFIADEVQCGAGRTGEYWDIIYRKEVMPDIMTYGKGVGGGFPVAGLLTRSEIVDHLSKGCLGGTYGGNAMACAAGDKTLEIMKDENILANVKQREMQLNSILQHALIKAVRLHGLICAIDFHEPLSADIVISRLRDRNVLALIAGTSLRLLPPLTITEEELDEFGAVLHKILDESLL